LRTGQCQESVVTVRVLFLCPHAAGKSVLAAHYFQAAAARLGLDATAEVAGPEPEEDLGPRTRRALRDQGFVERWKPRLVDEDITSHADWIVSIGCDVSDVPTDKPIVEWDVPLLTEDFTGAMEAIHERAEALARQLLAERP
jgi:protein-tyrosine-phosphatase